MRHGSASDQSARDSDKGFVPGQRTSGDHEPPADQPSEQDHGLTAAHHSDLRQRAKHERERGRRRPRRPVDAADWTCTGQLDLFANLGESEVSQ